MNYVVAAILSTDDDLNNALDGIIGPEDESVAFVTGAHRMYRYFSSSTATADGTTIVRPRTVASNSAGRWFVQGPPAVLPSDFAGNLNTEPTQTQNIDFSITLSGGSPTENSLNTSINDFLRQTDAVAACIHASVSSGLGSTITVSANLLHNGATIEGINFTFRATSGNLSAGAVPVRLTLTRRAVV